MNHPTPRSVVFPARQPLGISTVAVIACIVVVLVIALVAVVLLSPTEEAGPTEEQMKAEVQELGQMLAAAIQNDRDTSALIPHASKLARELEAYAPAAMFYGQVLMHNGRLDESSVQLRKSLELDPGADQAHALLGALHVKLEKYDAARSNFEEAISLNKELPDHRVKLANCELEAGDIDAAKRHALDALKLDSENHQAYMILSLAFEQEKDWAMAQQQMAKALDYLPGEEERTRRLYARRRATLLRRDNQPTAALTVLMELPRSDLHQMDVSEDLARTLGMLSQPATAALHYENLTQLDATNDDAAALAAEWYLKADEVDAAKRMVEHLKRVNPRHEKLLDLQKKVGEAQ